MTIIKSLTQAIDSSWSQYLLAFATALGALGFRAPPTWWDSLKDNPFVEWFTIFALIYQGGGQQKVYWSLLISTIVYLIWIFTTTPAP